MWRDILKNIQISSQKVSGKNYVMPDEEDCFAWFKKLYQLIQGDDTPIDELEVDDYREYTNEKLWCPLLEGMAFRQTGNYMQMGVQKLEWTSKVVLSGERVEFQFFMDIPEPSSQFGNDRDYIMMFSLWSTSGRIEIEFWRAATTSKTPLEYVSDGTITQLENYKEIAVKIGNYIKGSL